MITKYIKLKDRKNKFKFDRDKLEPVNSDIEKVSDAILKAKKNNSKVILMMGAHPIKVGLSQYIIDLLNKGYITDIAMNGACMIHDFEVGYCGETSEDVEQNLFYGNFGNADETGKVLNTLINGSECKNSIGEIMYETFNDSAVTDFNCNNCKNLTIHVAIGTDFIHCHDNADGSKIGQTTFNDFKYFVNKICNLENGVIINLGSAVLLPEILLKSLMVLTNRDKNATLNGVTTVNMDMLTQYRSINNVIKRPERLGATGIDIRAKHQVSIPLLHYLLTRGEKNGN
jgi:hypothetical protein